MKEIKDLIDKIYSLEEKNNFIDKYIKLLNDDSYFKENNSEIYDFQPITSYEFKISYLHNYEKYKTLKIPVSEDLLLTILISYKKELVSENKKLKQKLKEMINDYV